VVGTSQTAGWVLTGEAVISNSGWIVGEVLNASTGPRHAYLLSR